MKITTIGIDLAKNVFQVHGIDEHGKTVSKKQLRRVSDWLDLIPFESVSLTSDQGIGWTE